MNSSRIPLDRIFRSNPKASPPREIITCESVGPKSLPSPPYEISPVKTFVPEVLKSSPVKAFVPNIVRSNPDMSTGTTPSMMSNSPQREIMGTKTPMMLEYERQAEARAREQERIDGERARMQDELSSMDREAERIAQEEYEMEQYYRAEALRHAEEMRAHQEEVKKHQERVRAHERRMKDHEASSEAFARVIAMPANAVRAKAISFISPAGRTGTGVRANGPAGA